MDHDVFISYTSSDKAIADLLCNHLENSGIRAWYAPRDIASKEYAKAIIEAIDAARVFSLILCGKSSHSDHVLNEVAWAHDRMKSGLTIMPIRIDMEDISTSGQYYLNRQHWLDATTPVLEDKIRTYCQNVKSALNADRPTQTPIPTQDPIKFTNPKEQCHFEVGEVEIPDQIMSRIEKHLAEGEKHIEIVTKQNPGVDDMAWIQSTISIIREIDQLGFSGYYSNEQSDSLVGDWHHAQYVGHSSHEIKIMNLTNGDLNREVFGNYLSVIFGLQGRRAKVVLSRKDNPAYVRERSSYENPLDKFIFEYGLSEVVDDTKSAISNKLASGRKYIDDVEKGNSGPIQMAWIKSFEPIIRSIDSLGFSGRHSNEQSYSLIGEWHHAQYTKYSSFDIENMKLTDNDLNAERFGNYLSIIYSLLIGKARIVFNRIDTSSII